MRSDKQTYLLDGRLERAGFTPLLSAFLGLIVAFFLFQGISTVVLLVWGSLRGVTFDDWLNNLPATLADNADIVIASNTIGQVFGLLIPGLWFARLHSSTWRPFLRIRGVQFRFLLISVVALFALIPVVQWTGTLSDGLPWPDWIRDLEQGQMDLIEQVLTQDFSLLFTVSMLALTPAICEEVLFRGFVQRQAERKLGIWGGILFSGVMFGLYHLRLTQAIPLSMLGVFMAYLTWRTRSLLPAMLVHLANNSFAAILGKMASGGNSGIDLETFEFPIWIVFLSATVLGGSLYVMHTWGSQGESRGESEDPRDPADPRESGGSPTLTGN